MHITYYEETSWDWECLQIDCDCNLICYLVNNNGNLVTRDQLLCECSKIICRLCYTVLINEQDKENILCIFELSGLKNVYKYLVNSLTQK